MAITASEARKNLFPLIEQVNDHLAARYSRAHVARRLQRARGDRLSSALADERCSSYRRPRAGPRRRLCTTRLRNVNLQFTPTGWADYLYWQNTDRVMLKRLNRLLVDMLRDPFTGIGKPEPLRHMFQGAWSRRIDEEHRVVYMVVGDSVVVIQARHHY
jgi:toxin YoeB